MVGVRSEYGFGIITLPLLCFMLIEAQGPARQQTPTVKTLPALRQVLIDYGTAGQSVLPTAQDLTVPNLQGYPNRRYIEWLRKNWDGHTWSWTRHRHAYPYYYYRYYPKFSHYYSFIPYYDYWYTPKYEYTGRSVLLDELRLKDLYRQIEYQEVGILQHVNTSDNDRRLELQRATSRRLIELDRIKERIYRLRAP